MKYQIRERSDGGWGVYTNAPDFDYGINWFATEGEARHWAANALRDATEEPVDERTEQQRRYDDLLAQLDGINSRAVDILRGLFKELRP